MKIKKLQLTNFRNYSKKEIEFNSDSLLIVGNNGVGKTNILEAIYYLSTGKSFKAKFERELIMHGKQFTKIEANISNSDDETLLDIVIAKRDDFSNFVNKKARVNRTPKSLQNFSGNLTSVLFLPSDIELFTTNPNLRRKYLDYVISQTSIPYKKALSEFQKATRQINRLYDQIKEFGKGFEQLEFWESLLIKHGTFIQEHREEYINFVNEKIKIHVDELNSEKDITIKINYEKKAITPQRVSDYREKCIQAKSLLIGPQRDDFDVFLNEFNLNYFGSRGQQRSALLALKLCEIDFLTNKRKQRPLLLLDDIFSELDEDHKNKILQIINLQQTIITSAEPLKNLSEITDKMDSILL